MAAVPRSYLFVPGNRPDRFEKARAAGAHAVIIDLEDAVPPAAKSSARDWVASWLRPDRPVLIRINGVETDWFRHDLTLCRMPGVTGIMLPKTDSVEQLHRVKEILGEGVALLPLIETASGFANALAIAREHPVQRLVFGAIDFQVDLGIQETSDELLHFRSHLVLVSRLAGIQPPVDGIQTEIDNPEQVRTATGRARRLGFGGKLCIHPKQIGVVNECFLPTAEEIAWARRVVEAASKAQGAAVAADGEMIDRPVILQAQRILEEAGTE